MIEKLTIQKFRKFNNLEVPLGKRITVIAGKNATQKTTLLGIIAQPFSLTKGDDFSKFHTLMGTKFESQLNDKFKFSPIYDQPGEHQWEVHFDDPEIFDGIYPIKSSQRDTGGIRFWNASSREKGSGYVQLPVIFLSLKRLFPLGEENKNIKLSPSNLTEPEKEFYIKNYTEILISTEKINSPDLLTSSNKKSMIAGTNMYDAWGVSAGQDNIGQILMAVMSFRRLKEQHPNDYKGGLLLIDEVDATLYPASQEKLFEKLSRFSSDYNLQIFVTTHSMDILRLARKTISDRGTDDIKILYLNASNNEIRLHINPTIPDMENHLRVAAKKTKHESKIHVYCEDPVGCLFLKSILGRKLKGTNILDIVEFLDVNIGAEQLKDLTRRKIPEFTNSILILDGDKNSSNYKNIVILPGNGMPPERLFYQFLYDLPDFDEFWDQNLGGYDRDVCFRDCPNEQVDDSKIKQWFKNQKESGNWGQRSASKLFSRWSKENLEEIERVQTEFINAYNLLAKKMGLDILQ